MKLYSEIYGENFVALIKNNIAKLDVVLDIKRNKPWIFSALDTNHTFKEQVLSRQVDFEFLTALDRDTFNEQFQSFNPPTIPIPRNIEELTILFPRKEHTTPSSSPPLTTTHLSC